MKNKVNNLVELDGVGTAINVLTGDCWPMNIDDTCDCDEGESTNVVDTEAPEWFQELSAFEIDLVNVILANTAEPDPRDGKIPTVQSLFYFLTGEQMVEW